jgi:flavin-dependent thymidylate synthase
MNEKEETMKVTLFDYTGAGTAYPERYAAHILIYTKSTRLKMTPDLLDEIGVWSEQRVLDELKIMANTNPGSWEFINFSFLIEGVTRSFTHQLVRTRHASFAQQSLRVVDISKDFEYVTGPSIANNKLVKGAYDNTMNNTAQCYKHLIEAGVKIEDARGVLPTNILTNINMKIDMRNWIYLIRKRTSLRVQDEYRKVVDQMVISVEKVYPWIYIFIKNDELQAYKDLSNMIEESIGLKPEEKTAMYKKLDIIKGEL